MVLKEEKLRLSFGSIGTRRSSFSNCITPNAVCQPARASILTGILPCTHGVSDNGIDLSEDKAQLGFGNQFSKVGYNTGFIGKAHFSTHHTYKPTGTPECRWSLKNYSKDWFGPYMGFQHVETMVLDITPTQHQSLLLMLCITKDGFLKMVWAMKN